MMTRFMRGLLVAVNGLAGLSACGGGIALVAELESFPPQWLEGTPFRSYTIPGLILAVVVGGSAVFAAALLLWRARVGAMASMVAGAIMMGWIAGEVAMLNQPSAPTWIESAYFVIGLVMAGLGLALYRQGRVGA